MLVRLVARLLKSRVRIPAKYRCQSVRGLITHPEDSLCVNEDVLDPLGAVTPNKIQCQSRWPLACWDHVFKFQRAWMSISCRADHSSRGSVVCELGVSYPQEAVTPNKIRQALWQRWTSKTYRGVGKTTCGYHFKRIFEFHNFTSHILILRFIFLSVRTARDCYIFSWYFHIWSDVIRCQNNIFPNLS